MNDDMKNSDIDKKIIELLSTRSELFIDQFRNKLNKENLFSSHDKEKIIEIIKSYNNGPITDHVIWRIYNEIILNSMNSIMPLKIAFLGPRGTFSHIAQIEIFGESSEPVPLKTIPDIFHEVEVDNADFGVVPIENSTEGSVTNTLDELIETDLNIVAEKYIKVSFCLLSKNPDIKKIKRIYSHPQPVGQCKGWIRNNLPDAEIILIDSTSRAAEVASDDKESVAIASEITADLYNLNILYNKIEDSRQNYTRFFVIGKSDTEMTGSDKTSIICAINDRPAALLELLIPFQDAGINMTRIESRPDKKKMWEYNFFIDFIGHKNDEIVKDALEKMRSVTLVLKILGTYKIGN